MMKLLALAIAVAGCTKAQPESSPAPAPKQTPAPGVAFAEPPPTTPPPQAPLDAKVELTAVTLADDCDAIAPLAEPPAGDVRRDSAGRTRGHRSATGEYRVCDQTSMQLALSASTVSRIQIKSVELLDEHGTSLGMLTATKPTRWSDATARYDAWDEALAAGTPAKVSYRLSQPNWSKIGNRWNRTYTLKTVVSIGGVDRSVTKDVMRTAPTALPANVRT
jgi:hypothetical protein